MDPHFPSEKSDIVGEIEGVESSQDIASGNAGTADVDKKRRKKIDKVHNMVINNPEFYDERMKATELRLQYANKQTSPGPADESEEPQEETESSDEYEEIDIIEEQASNLVQPVVTEVLTCSPEPPPSHPEPADSPTLICAVPIEEEPPAYSFFANEASHEIVPDQTPIEIDEEIESIQEESKPVLTPRQEASREKIMLGIYDDIENVFEEDEECCGKCIDFCCQSCSCNCFKCLCFCRSKTDEEPEKLLELTPELREGRKKGMRDFKFAAFPLVPEALRLLWVVLELSLTIVGLVLSIITLSLDNNQAFTLVHFVLIIISTLLAGIDGLVSFKDSKLFKKLLSKCKCKAQTESTEKDERQAQNCCKKCYSQFTGMLDSLRLVLSEAIFYPLLICDIFELIVGKGYEGKSVTDRLGFALFIISLLGMLLTVYLARIIVLAGIVKNATAIRSKASNDPDPDLHDPEILKSAVWYQAVFFCHVVLQMIIQLLMYIAIAAKIRFDNRHFYKAGNTDEGIRVTNYLWYMIVAGYVLPFAGLFTFFIVTYYWSQQYPIGFHIDMIGLFKMTEYGITDLMRIKGTAKEKNEKLGKKMRNKDEDNGKVEEFLRKALIRKDHFTKMLGKPWCSKFTYPFKSPALVIICLIYFALQLAFVVCAAQAVDEMGEVIIHILNGGGWVFYYIAAIIAGVIANLYVLLVAGLWITVFALILLAIAIGITVCILRIVLSILCGRSND